VRILADENIATVFVNALRASGHDVEWVKEINPSAPDEWVLSHAVSSGRLLLTTDIELASTSLQLGSKSSGTVLLRFFDRPTTIQAAGVAEEINQRVDLNQRHTVITPAKVRSRIFIVT
jgi:predicted nuclease of predicted toxin-antitoxin system